LNLSWSEIKFIVKKKQFSRKKLKRIIVQGICSIKKSLKPVLVYESTMLVGISLLHVLFFNFFLIFIHLHLFNKFRNY
jgi:hypothetical protein